MVPAMTSERRYNTREVARLSKLSVRQVRGYVRSGVVTGGRAVAKPVGRGTGKRLRFEFRDILVLKAARKLLADGLPPARVERALAALRAQLPEAQSLSAVSVTVDGGLVVVSDGDVHWEPESGQARLALRNPASKIELPGPSARDELAQVLHSKKLPLAPMHAPGDVCSADGWFDTGLGAEDDDPDRAYEAYLRALACDPEHVEAMINIGRLCSEAGDDQRAAAYFRQATRCDPVHPVAHFNLAVTMHDHGAFEAALSAYSAALIHDPDFADAHYNLAALLDEMGDHDGAAEHMEAYRSVLGMRDK
jgi:tetratricopeptide (TPR) repeat protein